MYPQYLLGTPEQMGLLNRAGFSIGCTYLVEPTDSIDEEAWTKIADSRSPFIIASNCPSCAKPYAEKAREHIPSIPLIIVSHQVLDESEFSDHKIFSVDWESCIKPLPGFAWNALVQAIRCAPRA